MQVFVKKVCTILFFSVCTNTMYGVDDKVQVSNNPNKAKIGFLSSCGMAMITTWQHVKYHALEKEIQDMHYERRSAKYWARQLQVCSNEELIKKLTKLRKEYRKKIFITKAKSKIMARRTVASAIIAGSCFAYDLYSYTR